MFFLGCKHNYATGRIDGLFDRSAHNHIGHRHIFHRIFELPENVDDRRRRGGEKRSGILIKKKNEKQSVQ